MLTVILGVNLGYPVISGFSNVTHYSALTAEQLQITISTVL